MRALEIDAEAGTAWAEPGLTAGAYTTAAAERGLATGFGDTASVGIGGITLAGGVGYLVRKHGLTIDDLLAAEFVTADGQILEIDDERHPELFWAIRGGGWQLRGRHPPPVPPAPAGPGRRAACWCCRPPRGHRRVRRHRAGRTRGAVDHRQRHARPAAAVHPCRLARQAGRAGTLCHAGEAEAGQRALAPFRPGHPAGRPGAADALPGHVPPEEEGFHPTVVVHTMFLDRVDSDTAGTILEHLAASDAMLRVAQLRVLGGAMARVPAEATAFAHRGSPIMATVVCLLPGPRRQAGAPGLAGGVRGGAAPGRRRRLHRLPGRGRPGARPPGLPGVDLGPAGRG